MPDTDIFAALIPVAHAFDDLGIPYHVAGSVASSFFGKGRSTLDADVVCDMTVGHVHAFVDKVKAEYYVDETAVLQAVSRRSMCNLVHLATISKVDIYIVKSDPFHQEIFRRRSTRTVPMEDGSVVSLSFATPEDTIMHKLLWFEMGGRVSERQWFDLVGVLKVQSASLDFPYMRRIATTQALSELLVEACGEAGLPPNP